MNFKVSITKIDIIMTGLLSINKKLLVLFPILGSVLIVISEFFQPDIQSSFTGYHYSSPFGIIFIFIGIIFHFTFYFLIILVLILLLVIPILVIHQVISPLYKKAPINIEYNFNNENLKWKSIAGNSVIKWGSVVKVMKLNKYLVIKLITNQAITIPINELKNTKEYDQLLSILKEKGKLMN